MKRMGQRLVWVVVSVMLLAGCGQVPLNSSTSSITSGSSSNATSSAASSVLSSVSSSPIALPDLYRVVEPPQTQTELQEESDFPNDRTEATPIAIAQSLSLTITGRIDTEQDVDSFVFMPEQTEHYRISSMSEKGTVWYRVYHESGIELKPRPLRHYLLEAGNTYYVKLWYEKGPEEFSFKEPTYALHVGRFNMASLPVAVRQGLINNEGKPREADRVYFGMPVTDYYTYYKGEQSYFYCYQSTYEKENERKGNMPLDEYRTQEILEWGFTEKQIENYTVEDYGQIFGALPASMLLEGEALSDQNIDMLIKYYGYDDTKKDGYSWTIYDYYNCLIITRKDMVNMEIAAASNNSSSDVIAAFEKLKITKAELDKLLRYGELDRADIARFTREEIDAYLSSGY